MSPRSFEIFAGVLKLGSGLAIGAEKQYLLETRLAGIIARHGMRDLDDLAARLHTTASAFGPLEHAVIEAMTTNESFFFRDEKPFTHLRSSALPRLQAARAPGIRLRIWSAAASSGQEAYSLAMLVAEARGVIGNRFVEIVATDISREQLTRAREGLYTQFEVQRGLPMQYLVRYFSKEGVNWRLSDTIRAMVAFREWNLLADLRPLGTFDAVFCRNVLIYFDRETKTRVLEAIAAQMAPDGVLYLGGAETVLGLTNRFAVAPGERGVYTLVAPTPRPARARYEPALMARS